MEPFDITGRVALVTGASGGLGRAAADRLAAAGARVVGLARRADILAEWQRTAPGEAATLVADLAETDRLADIIRAAADPFGPPHIIVNAAGCNPRRSADHITLAEWRATLDLNLTAPFLVARTLVPAMRAAGWGRIVNFASLQSRRAFPDGIAYGASKGGVEQMTRAMAEAWSGDGIMVNALAPGFFPTGLTRAVFADPGRAAANAAQTCVGRNGDMADLAGPLLFLCSDACRYVTGQVLFVDGGFTAK